MSERAAPLPEARRAFGFTARDVTPILVVLAAVAAGLSGQEPTGNIVADFVLTAAFAAFVTWCARWADTQSLVWSAMLLLFFSGLQFPVITVAVAAALAAGLAAFGPHLDPDRRRIMMVVAGAFISFGVLDIPNIRWVGSASIFAVITVAPLIIGAWPRLSERLRRSLRLGLIAAGALSFVATVLFGIAALGARDVVERGIAQAEDGVTALEAGDQDQAVALLEASEANFGDASDRLGGPLTWPARWVPIVAQHARALETAANEGTVLARAAVRTLTTADVDAIRGSNGAIDLALVSSIDTELSTANAVLRDAQTSIRSVRTPWLLPFLDSRMASVEDELVAIVDDIDLANHATSVLPGILGGNGVRTYLVLFVQPSEAREFGGFVGAYGLLRAEAGQLSLLEAGSILDDLGNGVAELTDAGDFPIAYQRARPWENPQNLTAIADLGTIAAAAQDLVPQWRQDPLPIDGVFTIDPYALAGLMELTGPIELDGADEPLGPDNVVDFLLREQYLTFEDDGRDIRQDALRDLAAVTFVELLGIEVPGPEELGAIFGPLARADRLAFTTFDEAENVFLRRVFLDADMPVVPDDVQLLGVYNSTGVAAKLDAYTERDVTYAVAFDPATGAAVGRLDVTLTNNAPPDAPGYVLGDVDAGLAAGLDGELPLGDNLVALSYYTAGVVSDVDAAGASFRVNEPTDALGYQRVQAVVEVPLGASATVSATITQQLAPGRFEVVVPAQATAEVGTFSLVVTPPPGWRVAGGGGNSDGSFSVSVDLDSPRRIAVIFEAES